MTEANETSAALDQTVAQLQQGVPRVGIGSGIPVVASWERTLKASPALTPIAENLGSLRARLAAPGFDPAEVDVLLLTLGIRPRP